MSTGKFLAGFIVGGAVGALTGILLAPRPGEETRKMIADTTSETYKKTEESVKELQDKADTVLSDLQHKGDELLKKVQDLVKKQEA